MAVSMIGPKIYCWDRNGKPLAFGKLYTYQARTNTPKDTYQSEDQVVANTNPVILNGEGYTNIYLDGSYKVVLKDSDENEIWSADPVTSAQATEWVNCLPANYNSPTTVKVVGNFSEQYEPGRRVRIDNNTAEYAYSTIKTSVYAAGETTIEFTDSVVTTGVQGICASIVGSESRPTNAVINHSTLQEAKDDLLLQLGDALNLAERVANGDGGAMWDVVLTSSTTPDGAIVVQSAAIPTLSFVLRIDGELNIKQAGVVDDISVDSTDEFNACWQYCIDNNATLYIPAGKFAFSELRTNTPVRTIRGTGQESTLYYTGTGSSPAFDMTQNPGGYNSLNWYGFLLQSSGDSTGHGISLVPDGLNGYQQSQFELVHVLGFKGTSADGWYLDTCWSINFTRCDSRRNGRYGWNLDGAISSVNDITFTACNFRYNDMGQISIGRATAINIFGGNISDNVEGNGGFGVRLGNDSGRPRGVVIKGVYSENLDYVFDLYNCEGVEIGGCRIGGWGDGSTGSVVGTGYRLGQVRQSNLGSNFYRDLVNGIQVGHDYGDGAGVRFPVQTKIGGISEEDVDNRVIIEPSIETDYSINYEFQPRTKVSTGDTQSIPDSTYTKIEWNDVIDFQGFWDSANKTRLTVDGSRSFVQKVELTANIRFTSQFNSGELTIRLVKNGSSVSQMAWNTTTANGTNFQSLNISSGPISVIEGDYFELEVFHETGGARDLVDNGSNWIAIRGVN